MLAAWSKFFIKNLPAQCSNISLFRLHEQRSEKSTLEMRVETMSRQIDDIQAMLAEVLNKSPKVPPKKYSMDSMFSYHYQSPFGNYDISRNPSENDLSHMATGYNRVYHVPMRNRGDSVDHSGGSSHASTPTTPTRPFSKRDSQISMGATLDLIREEEQGGATSLTPVSGSDAETVDCDASLRYNNV